MKETKGKGEKSEKLAGGRASTRSSRASRPSWSVVKGLSRRERAPQVRAGRARGGERTRRSSRDAARAVRGRAQRRPERIERLLKTLEETTVRARASDAACYPFRCGRNPVARKHGAKPSASRRWRSSGRRTPCAPRGTRRTSRSSPASSTRRCARFPSTLRPIDAAKIAILTALNISDEFHQYRSKSGSEGDPGRLAKRATRLVEKLDEILKTSLGPFRRGPAANRSAPCAVREWDMSLNRYFYRGVIRHRADR